MIVLEKKEDCCGCSACQSICPKNSIVLKEDNEGFMYPDIDTITCVDCGKCEKVCPVINRNQSQEPLFAYASKSKDLSIRMKSSSGGIFTLLSEEILNNGDAVFAANFNQDRKVIHSYVKANDEL